MTFNEKLENYARLTVRTGVNVQKNQILVIRATTNAKEFVRELAKQAYLVGAKKVYTLWADEYVANYTYDFASDEVLETVDEWYIMQQKYFVDNNACFISVTSPITGLNANIDPLKIQKSSIAMQKAVPFLRDYTMGNKGQWVVVAAANQIWAEKVFPNENKENALGKLWDAIFNASRVWDDNDPVEEWKKHNLELSKHNEILNNIAFKSLHFTNSLGTDLIVELVDNHIWSGGGEKTTGGVVFNPNIPTEETFTMPFRFGTKGKVVATKPLDYQGKLIEDFYLVFEGGKVVEFDAKKELSTLKSLLNTDDGSSYIGEIALISHDSPISNTNLLFYNTLFDENASCHMALGKAYPMNIKNGLNMKLDELQKFGYNHSMIHCDFMFGSKDMKITGTTKDNKEMTVFENGNFVI